MTDTPTDLQLCANVIRGLAMDAVEAATCGHPGMPMGMADAATVLWAKHFRFDPGAPQWLGRDRFVLSAGHGSMLLYSLLHLAGYDLSLDDIKAFRQWGSKTPGHPEFGHTAGVETTTGPLGQGFANGVGLALAAKMSAARFDCPHLENRVFGIVSDGDLMEGVAQEAASLAGHLGLDNLVYLYDDNEITIDGRTNLAFGENVPARFEALGWETHSCDGHDMAAVDAALTAAIASDRPVLIATRTTIGKGSPNKQDTSASHGAALGADEIRLTKDALGIAQEAFWVPDEAKAPFGIAADQGRRAHAGWQTDMDKWRVDDPGRAKHLDAFLDRHVPEDLFDSLREVVEGQKAATRALSGKVIQKAAELVPSLVGGAADLEGSTKTGIKNSPAVRKSDYRGRNLHFGVREHAMGAMLNGLALHGGFLPMGSTFLVFADYMRPTIRLAALMGIPVTFVFTHDSLMVGEDGPTHQPVEQLASLRCIPGLQVWRPADGVETAAAWAAALQRRDGPNVLVLTRQGLPALDWNDATRASIQQGAATMHDPAGAVATLVATGSEVSLALEAAEQLGSAGRPIRVVSMPCVERFHALDAPARAALVPPTLPVFALEMGSPMGWSDITGSRDRVIGVDRFGASAPHAELSRYYGFTAEAVAERVSEAL